MPTATDYIKRGETRLSSTEVLEMNALAYAAKSIEPLERVEAEMIGMPRFVIGRGRRGGWVVNDTLGLIGGIFISEAAARHYVFEEAGGHSDQSVVLSGYLDLELRKTA